MIRVKNILSLSLLIFVSCEFHTAIDPLYPIPVLKVKMGEEKAFDLSNYFRNENISLLFNESLQHISLLGNELIIDATSVKSGFENISLIADGQPIHILIEYEFMARHTFSFESEKFKDYDFFGTPKGDFYVNYTMGLKKMIAETKVEYADMNNQIK